MDKKYETIDEYIDSQDPQYQDLLIKVRQVMKEAASEATERMSYGIPTFWYQENIIHFGLSKQHLGVYPGSEAIVVFKDRLTNYQTSKGTIRMPLDKEIDFELIKDITTYNLKKVKDKQ